tara:strand:+ start:2782 stop:2976 length:195 start_codon:yes stop_codon:yes gene_type:complete
MTRNQLLKTILSNDGRLRFKDAVAKYNDGTPHIRNGQLKIIRVPKYTMASAFIDAAIKEAKNAD